MVAAHYQPHTAKYISVTNTFVMISISGRKKIENFWDQVDTVSSDVDVMSCQTVVSMHFDRSDWLSSLFARLDERSSRVTNWIYIQILVDWILIKSILFHSLTHPPIFVMTMTVYKSKKYFLQNFLFASDRRNILHDSFEVTFDPSKYSKIRKRNSLESVFYDCY